MTDFSVTNSYANTATGGVLFGTSGEDRLIYTYTRPEGGVSMTLNQAQDGSYNGLFDGYFTNNVYYSGFENFTINMQVSHNDTLRTGSGDDSIFANGGDDYINSGSGVDSVDGGTGHDFWQADLSALSTPVIVNLNGQSTINGTGYVRNVEGFNLTTGSGNDVLTGYATGAYNSGDYVASGAGDDTITLEVAGWDTVAGGDGSDRLIVSNKLYDFGNVTVSGFTPTADTTGYSGLIDGYFTNNINFSGIEHFTFTDYTSGTDHFTSGDGNDSLSGGGGDDTLRSGRGLDTIDGGDGWDYWQGDTSWSDTAVAINLNGVSNFLNGASVQNIEGFDVTTGGGNDTLTGLVAGESNYSDVVTSGDGEDLITLWMGGWDTVDGEAGDDRLFVTNTLAEGGVTVSGFVNTPDEQGYSGLIDGYFTNNINFSAIENFTFIDKTNGPDNFTSGDGDDSLDGGGGIDVLNSGAGSDTIDGGDGADRWIGDQSAASADLTLNLNGISDLPGGGTLRNVESFYVATGSGDDSLTGHDTSAMADSVTSGAGNDTISLQIGGWDTVDGQDGSDRLVVTSGLSLTPNVTVSGFAESNGQTGYSGLVDGYFTNNITFAGIEHFTFTDTAGGTDNFTSGDGNDSLNGGAGNDVLSSGAGADTVDGGDGADRWIGDQTAASEGLVLDLNTVSTLHGGGTLTNIESFYVSGGSGSDAYVGHETSGMADSVLAGAGNDTIELTVGGWDTVDGQGGQDRLIVHSTLNETPDVAVSGFVQSADQTGYSGLVDGYFTNNITFAGIEHFTFTDSAGGNDLFTSGTGNDVLFGGEGDDTLNSGSGNDVIDGGDGWDYWSSDQSARISAVTVDLNTVSTLPGGSTVRNIEGMNLTTGSGNDTVTAAVNSDQNYSDVLTTNAGDDLITLWMGGWDTVAGGAGNDRLVVTNNLTGFGGTTISGLTETDGGLGYSGLFDGYFTNNITFSGIRHFTFTDLTNGTDRIYTGNGNDSLSTGGANDTIEAGAGADTLDGGAGDDYLVGGTGNDIIRGGAGTDTLRIHDTLANATFSGTAEAMVVVSADGTDQLNGIEKIQFDDDLIDITNLVGPEDLTLVGTEGDDNLTGALGNDTISGLGGNDTLSGGAGNDSILGGDGLDTIVGGTGDDFLFGGSSEADLRDVIYGGDGNDSLDGGYGNDELRGDAGIDSITGGYGVDSIFGGDGDDVLTGQAWSDLIFGGAGNDFINGGFGFDRVNGGDGADQFFHIGVFGHGSDWIQDYSAAEGDVLVYGGGVGTATASDFLVQRANTPNAGDALFDEIFVTHIPSGNLLWALVDGDAQTDLMIRIGGVDYDLLAG